MSEKELLSRIAELRKTDPKIQFAAPTADNAVEHIRGRLSPPREIKELRAKPFENARQFISTNKMLFGDIDEHVVLANGKSSVDQRGLTHVTLTQRHGNVEVLGAEVSVHFQTDGSIYQVNASLIQGIDAPKEATIDAGQAVQRAVSHAGRSSKIAPGAAPSLLVVRGSLLQSKRKLPRFFLCWRVMIEEHEGKTPGAWVYFIDATTGEVLFRHTALIAGTATGYYSTGTAFNSSPSGTVYIASDATTSSSWPVTARPKVNTKDGTTGAIAQDADDVWGDTTLPPRSNDERALVDVHRYLGYALSWFYSTFAHNSWNNAGGELIGTAHYGTNLNNAYWNSASNQILVGDGDGVSYDFFGAFDVLTHELTHGLNDGFNVVQTYSGETGAINEGLADSFAALASLDHPTEDPLPWTSGERICIPPKHPRSLSDPARDSSGTVLYDATNNTTKLNSAIAGYFPDHYDIRYTGTSDYGGVHINCPILGHAIFLMVSGGTNRISGVAVAGIGAAPVEQMLYHVISTPGLLTNSSTFPQFRRAMIEACLTLYPDNLDYLVTVKTGFKAVGIGPDVYIRDTLADVGVEPGTLSYLSPDIISRRELADATVLAQLGDMTNGSLSEDIVVGHDQFIYVRLTNGGNAPVSATVRLFLAPASSFPSPAAWTEVGTLDVLNLAAGASWHPTNASEHILLPATLSTALGTGHFCFIAVVESADDPAPDRMQISDISEFWAFISKSNNYAWRNCNIVPVPSSGVAVVAFEVGALARRGVAPIELEVDARQLPEGAEVFMMLQREPMGSVKLFDVQRVTPQIDILRPGELLKPRRLDNIKLVSIPAAHVLVQDPAELVETLALKSAKELEPFALYRLEPKRLTRFTALLTGRKAKARFGIKLPKGIGRRDIHVAFRQLHKGELIGQMNFIFRVK